MSDKQVLEKTSKKSFSLIVGFDEAYTPGETLIKSESIIKSKIEAVSAPAIVTDIRKSRIEKIERILLARRK